MENKKTKFMLAVIALFFAITILSFLVGGYVGYHYNNRNGIGSSDTIIKIDTFIDPNPQLVHDTLWKIKKVPVKVGKDTIIKNDTIIKVNDSVAIIPISLRTYSDSSTYKVMISGYDPRLESIELYQTTTIITQKEEESRFSWGLQAGMYVTQDGLRPAIGIGATYRLGSFGKRRFVIKNK